MDAFIPIHRKVYARTLYDWRGLLRIVVSRVSFGLRGRKVVHSRKATSWKVSNMGVFSRLSQCPLAVGRAFVVFGVLVAQPLAAPLRANLVFEKYGLLRRVEMLFTRSRVVGCPAR